LNIASNLVLTDAEVSGTTVTMGRQVQANTVRGTLSCVGNEPPFGGSFNTAAALRTVRGGLFNYRTATTPGDSTKCPRPGRHDTRLQDDGHELIEAGMLILAGGGRGLPLDYDELERWTRVGFERGTRSRHGER
jgi:hypothetical protein